MTPAGNRSAWASVRNKKSAKIENIFFIVLDSDSLFDHHMMILQERFIHHLTIKDNNFSSIIIEAAKIKPHHLSQSINVSTKPINEAISIFGCIFETSRNCVVLYIFMLF